MMVFKDTELDHFLYKGGLSVLRLYGLDKARRLSINIVIWILSSDTVTICQFNHLHTNSEAAMLCSLCPPRRCCPPSLPPTSAYFDVRRSAYSRW